MRPPTALAVAILLVAGCAQPNPAPSKAAAESSAPSASSAPSTALATQLSTRPTQSSPAPGAASPRLDRIALGLVPVATGFAAPLFATGAGDNSGRLFVVEQAGVIRIVEGNRILPTPFLDIRHQVSSGGERGLLGLAFSPHFGPGDGRFYVDYTDTNGDTAVAQFTVDSGRPDQADPGTGHVLLHVDQPYPNHNGGGIAFGPDGMLYVGLGDGGSEGDPHSNGQALDTLLGKLLRIDVTTTPRGDKPYLIPADNPFVGRDSAKPEIWAYGLRNPWRFSFDRSAGSSGDLWIGDVGQNRWEEIDRVTAATSPGLNFGWNVMEASHCYQPAEGCSTSGLTLPLTEYGHDQGCSVTGGYVYRGRLSPPLQGVYLFGDYCSGRIWGVDAAGPSRQDPTLLLESGHAISSFGQDDADELYVTDLSSGELLHVTATSR